MTGGQQIEQRALHLGAGQPGGFLLQLAAQQALELVQPFEAERLGEIIVRLGFAGNLHRLDGNVEGGVLALEVFGRIVGREGHGDGLFVTGLHANQLFLETWDEAARTQFERGVGGAAAFEGDAIKLADEIDDQLIAVFGLLALLGIGEALRPGGQLAELFIDFGVRHGHN